MASKDLFTNNFLHMVKMVMFSVMTILPIVCFSRTAKGLFNYIEHTSIHYLGN